MYRKTLKIFYNIVSGHKNSLGYCVPIRGGLGGQINGFLAYEYLKKIANVPVLADVMELMRSSGYRLAKPGEGLNQNVWNLNYYGIEPGKNLEILSAENSSAEGYHVVEEGTLERDALIANTILIQNQI